MIDHLRILDQEAVSLKTDCIWRNQEIDNIRASIQLTIQFIERRLPVNMHDVFVSAQKRLKELKERPNFAGNHEKFKPLNA